MIFRLHNYWMVFAVALVSIGLLSLSALAADDVSRWSDNLTSSNLLKHHTTSKALPKSEPCTKLRAPDPRHEKCSGKINIAPANARSRSNNDEFPLLQHTEATSFIRSTPRPSRFQTLESLIGDQ